MTEKELVEKLKRQDEGAFRDLVDLHQVKVRNTCMGMLHDASEADDMSQEVFIEIFTSIRKFKGESTLSTWMYRIAINKCLNHLRSKKRKNWIKRIGNSFETQTEMTEISDYKEPQTILENTEKEKMLKAAVDSLPDNQRVAFVLSKYDELSNPEIAEIMKTTVSSVESLNFRAKRNLQKKLLHLFKEFND